MDQQKKIKINITPDRTEARFSDFLLISKGAFGFTFDFGQRMPSGDSINIVSRIAMSPQHAKMFLQILKKNVDDFEAKFGEIKIPENKTPTPETDDKTLHFVS